MSGYPAMFEHSARLGMVVSTWLFYLLSVSQTACSLESAPAAAPPRLAPQASVLTAAALLLVGAWGPCVRVLPRRSGIGPTLQRHPFSGLVDSAGELLHTP